jgi:ERCC4-type nuclease
LKGRTEETKEELLKNISKVEQYLAENKLQYFGGEFNNILLL